MNRIGLVGEGLSKRYEDRYVVDGVSLQLSPGRITALLGPNGCGKSTLLRLLACLEKPDRGSLLLDGRVLIPPYEGSRQAPSPWPHVTLVFQQLFLWPHLSLKENIRLPLMRVYPETWKEQLHEVIEVFGLCEFVGRFPNEASLGQRQRAALARAWALKPRYLLLDEVTSSLDIEQVGFLKDQLKLLKERGVGILLVTHFLGFAHDIADDVIFLWSGKVFESGSIDLLLHPETAEFKRFLRLMDTAPRNHGTSLQH